ncbi:LytR/AlgR family response regulator transcription factor [Enterococcus sp. LJL90]
MIIIARIYICEDNVEQLKRIERQVTYYTSFSQWNMKLALATCYPEEVLSQLIIDEEPNIYIFDIELSATSQIDGFNLGKKIREKDPHGYLIYLTSHLELSYLTFEFHVNAIDFIIKDGPQNWEERLKNCLQSIEKQLFIMKDNRGRDSVEVDTFYGNAIYFIEDIVAFESIPDHKIILYTENEQIIILHTSLKKLENCLKENFYRCHRSFLINRNKMRGFETADFKIRMSNRMRVPVSPKNRAESKRLIKALSSVQPVN